MPTGLDLDFPMIRPSWTIEAYGLERQKPVLTGLPQSSGKHNAHRGRSRTDRPWCKDKDKNVGRNGGKYTFTDMKVEARRINTKVNLADSDLIL